MNSVDLSESTIIRLAAEVVRQMRVAERVQDEAEVSVTLLPLEERQRRTKERRRQIKEQAKKGGAR